MKKTMIVLGLFFLLGALNSASAQNVNRNIDKQPPWGPAGYDYVEHYYFPDIDIYYDVVNSLFYYFSSSKWVSSQYLPDKYRKYDFYNMYKVVINEPHPWQNNKNMKKTYAHYKGDKTQECIRYSNDSKYDNSKKNPRHWVDRNNQNGANGSKPQDANKKPANNNNNQPNNGAVKDGNQSGANGNKPQNNSNNNNKPSSNNSNQKQPNNR